MDKIPIEFCFVLFRFLQWIHQHNRAVAKPSLCVDVFPWLPKRRLKAS